MEFDTIVNVHACACVRVCVCVCVCGDAVCNKWFHERGQEFIRRCDTPVQQ